MSWVEAQRILNLVISRRHLGDDGKEMYQIVKRTCRGGQSHCFYSLNPLFGSVLIAVGVDFS